MIGGNYIALESKAVQGDSEIMKLAREFSL